MKKVFNTLICVPIATICLAQQVQLFAYKQAVVPGARQTIELNEDGTSKEIRRSAKQNLFIYLKYPTTLELQVLEVIVEGKPFKSRTEAIHKTPVVYKLDDSLQQQNFTLVQKTNCRVLMLTPIEEIPSKNTSSAEDERPELVVVYTANGKKSEISATKFRHLPRGILQ